LLSKVIFLIELLGKFKENLQVYIKKPHEAQKKDKWKTNESVPIVRQMF